ncbi:hypothetical protein P154DRAFT_463070 [Amniculicola lignicola CBS 123094]|uniref:Zn(2)-C6 fungal-type domain-containing protein n=1 Tax=Amniculicola lignicola CBS 123094 TaxID=1392246 RepID=A0A6A5WM22_9PLEO|nr:hypothetical protein P154DRAFT_463070 [Amniculicola lignicola CBS 123094]
MVYRGRPSTGCLRCRKRKIKCDEKSDGCVNCASKGFVCPGYENAMDRIFQNETDHVKEKAIKSKAKAIAKREERWAIAKCDKSLVKERETLEQLTIPLLTTAVDHGINFFMTTYVLGLDQPPVQSENYHRHLSTHGFHPIIATSMTALGLAGISNLVKDKNVMNEAMLWYMQALKMTNSALASPKDVRSDNTLLATMLLSMFESTSNDRSLIAWTNHVEGAASLLKLRGREQFSTPAGRRMYMQTVGLLTVACMGRGVKLPDYVHDMNEEVMKHERVGDPGNQFYHLHIAIVDFRSQILNGEITDLHTILDKALELDAIGKSVFNNVNAEWEYDEVHTARDVPGIYSRYYHVYLHMSAAQTWNWVRYNRIYINDIIRNTLIAGLNSTPPTFTGTKFPQLLEESTATLQKMQADIFASMPQHLHITPSVAPVHSSLLSPSFPVEDMNRTTSAIPQDKRYFWSNFRAHMSTNEFTTPAIAQDRLPIIRVSGGYSSLWALYIAGSMPTGSMESRVYTVEILERIREEFGINQAGILSKALGVLMGTDGDGDGRKDSGYRRRVGKDGWKEIVVDYLPTVGEHVED